ncbi:sensor histidine kinase [Amycolatopsis saalfeldensis]|uniref:sensor histidine kinase n=1 Tax=Amycolatopsis saalfeldensis TaxID=394193 RepID=UPI0015A64D29|nr:histidine kinase dimerization/phospho-acceptor domain-containing protein [Amycolatopsis saalfeldensis]
MRRITATARRLSSQNLHRSGGHHRRNARPERGGFTSQRRFIADASHEIRTPLAVQRTALQVGLADPTPKEPALIRDRLLADNRRSERPIEGLLLLARSDQGVPGPAPVRLDEVVDEVLARHGTDLRGRAAAALVRGEVLLLTRLLADAVRYSTAGGTVWVRTTPPAGCWKCATPARWWPRKRWRS